VEERKVKAGVVPAKTIRSHTLILLLALCFFLILFAASETQSACASPPAPKSFDPGGGPGCGGGPPTETPNTVEGHVTDFAGMPAADIYVNLAWSTDLVTVTTNSSGHFQFYTGCGLPGQPIIVIQPDTQYLITVNGGSYDEMGDWIANPTWGQWAGQVTTDNIGWAQMIIRLQPAAIVNIPAAALFSNTKYAVVSYEYQGTHTISHSLTFSVPVVGITIGYQSQETSTSGIQVISDPNTAVVLSRKYYAASYYDDTDSCPGVKKTGITGREPNWDWVASNTNEYLNTTSPIVVNNHKEEIVGFNMTCDYYYYEQGTTTWSVTQGMPFAISYLAWGTNIALDVTATTSSSNRVDFTINRHNDPDPNQLTFWLYTAGALIDPGNHHGGMEFHIWDVSGAG
jgi:hypothetical protein